MVVAPTAASAAWLRAETDRFVIYNRGGEAQLRAFTAKLTAYDAMLRRFHPGVAKPATKVQVFMLADASDLKRVRPNAPAGTAGFYSATNEGVFAFSVKATGLESDDVLFHEYAHHFMRENFPAAYPAWFIEGWAEYFMTTDIRPTEVRVGNFAAGRAYGIVEGDWLPLKDILSKSPLEFNSQEQRAMFYAQSWLLMHYMRKEPARAAQLSKAMNAIAAGEEPVKAFETATGMTMAQLTAELRRYKRISYFLFKTEQEQPAMTITALPPSADDLLLDNARLYIATRVDARFVEGVRAKAAKYPGDKLAELTLARAEFIAGDVAAGEAIMKRRLAAPTVDIDDYLAAGWGQIIAGYRDRPNLPARYRAARAPLSKAYALDDDDFRILYAYSLSRSVEPTFPNENDLNVLLLARELAPSVDEVSVRAGLALWKRGRVEDAKRALAPAANNPHGGRTAERLRALISSGKLEDFEKQETSGEAEDEEQETPPSPEKKPAS